MASLALARPDAGYSALPDVFHGSVRNTFLWLTPFTLHANFTVPSTNLLLNIRSHSLLWEKYSYHGRITHHSFSHSKIGSFHKILLLSNSFLIWTSVFPFHLNQSCLSAYQNRNSRNYFYFAQLQILADTAGCICILLNLPLNDNRSFL